MFFCVFFVVFINFFNFGKISTTLITVSIMGFIWGKKSLKSVVFLIRFWYTKINSRRHEHKQED